jgi:hypothetical protein
VSGLSGGRVPGVGQHDEVHVVVFDVAVVVVGPPAGRAVDGRLRGQLILGQTGLQEFHNRHGLALPAAVRRAWRRLAGAASRLPAAGPLGVAGLLGGKLALQVGDLGLQFQYPADGRQGESLAGQADDLLDAADLDAAVAPLAAVGAGRLNDGA